MLQSQNTTTIDHVLDNRTITKYNYIISQSVKSRHSTKITTEQNTHISIPPLTLDPYDGPGRNQETPNTLASPPQAIGIGTSLMYTLKNIQSIIGYQSNFPLEYQLLLLLESRNIDILKNHQIIQFLYKCKQ